MPHRYMMDMAGTPQIHRLHEAYADHCPHETVLGSDRFSQEKIERMAEGRKR